MSGDQLSGDHTSGDQMSDDYLNALLVCVSRVTLHCLVLYIFNFADVQLLTSVSYWSFFQLFFWNICIAPPMVYNQKCSLPGLGE